MTISVQRTQSPFEGLDVKFFINGEYVEPKELSRRTTDTRTETNVGGVFTLYDTKLQFIRYSSGNVPFISDPVQLKGIDLAAPLDEILYTLVHNIKAVNKAFEDKFPYMEEKASIIFE